MNKKPSVKLNMVMNAILTMSTIIFPLITFPYISRVILPEGVGKVQFANSVVAYFSMFAQLGIPVYGVRACAKVRDDKEELSRVVQELLMINLATMVLIYAMFGTLLFTVDRFASDKPLFLVMGITIALDAIGVEWLYKALEKYTYITARSVAFKFIALVAMLLMIKNEGDYVLYGGISIFAASASNLLNFYNLRKHVTLKPVGHYNFRRHLRMIFVFLFMSVATTIYTHLDDVMLGFIRDDTEVGYYTAAVKVKSILVNLVTSTSIVLLPRASYYVDKGEKSEFYRILRKAMHLTVVLSMPCCAYFILYAGESIRFLSGAAFAPARLPMILLMPTLIFIAITNVIGIQMMIPLGREKEVLYSVSAGAITDLVVNILLIECLGATGAAVGTLMAEFVVLIFQLVCIRKDLAKELFSDIEWTKIVPATILGTVLCLAGKYVPGRSIYQLVVSAVIFFGTYGIYMLVAKNAIVVEIVSTFVGKIVRTIRKS